MATTSEEKEFKQQQRSMRIPMLMKPLDALTNASITTNIKSCSRRQLISFLSTMNKSDIQHILFTYLKSYESQCHDPYPSISKKTERCINRIINHFANCRKPKKSKNIQNSRLVLLPSSIVAYIISFNTMYDRVKYQSICKDFYKFCQIPIAKYHLTVDHRFVKAIYNNNINVCNFSHTQYIDLKYVFMNKRASLAKYGDLESKYYSFISKILSKSPSLHTINYNLQYKKFKSDLESYCVGGYDGNTGHLLQWMRDIQENNHSVPKMFDSVKTLNWIPSQISFWHQIRWLYNDYDSFCRYLPNLTSINIDKIKIYGGYRWWYRAEPLFKTDIEFEIFNKSFYYEKLQHIDINMIPNRKFRIPDRAQHVDTDYHPLHHFYKFRALKSINLRIPLFNQCQKYYSKLWSDTLQQQYMKYKCKDLYHLNIEFDESNIINFDGNNGDRIINKYGDTANDIIKYILSFSPNITHYNFIGNDIVGPFSHFDHHLIGYYDRLQFLETDFIDLIPKNMRLISLNTLIIRTYCQYVDIWNKLDLSLYPNLKSFKLICINKSERKYTNLNQNILKLFNFLMKQKSNKYLKYIGIHHETLNKSKKIKPQKSKFFNARNCTKNESLKICKSIISLFTLNNEFNFNLENIELKPVAMTQKDINYLSFWFCGEFGSFKSDNYGKLKNGIFLNDLLCISTQTK